ncbi:hypothetical protein [Candidatus Nanohalococcus occultus]|uniref:hypothetical protein n=1 Tax=Candidatus Nanohalococcus occultus TaxID=2978047 RepID=UPI0039DFF8AA
MADEKDVSDDEVPEENTSETEQHDEAEQVEEPDQTEGEEVEEPNDGKDLKVTSGKKDSESAETTVNVESAKERLVEARENIELDKRHYLYAPALTVGTGLIVFLAFSFLSADLDPETEQQPELNLTPYQQEYVDCPRDLIDTCTKMSKIPTEEVTYWKTEDDWVYMKLGDGRAIISTTPKNGSTGEFVTYMSAAEVNPPEEETETSSNQSTGNQTVNATA